MPKNYFKLNALNWNEGAYRGLRIKKDSECKIPLLPTLTVFFLRKVVKCREVSIKPWSEGVGGCACYETRKLPTLTRRPDALADSYMAFTTTTASPAFRNDRSCSELPSSI